MKTDLTKNIEKALRQFNPDKLSNLLLNHKRDSIRVAEVTVANSNVREGIVDFMRAEEFMTPSSVEKLCYLNWRAKTEYCEKKLAPGERRKRCDHPSCRFRTDEQKYDNHKLISAFEIKVTAADFKSKHGHNFIGNLNYYVLPGELIKTVKNEVPKDIGIILYQDGVLTEFKASTFKELTVENLLERTWCILKASRTGENVSKAIKTRRRSKQC